jgi:hypothetical protein
MENINFKNLLADRMRPEELDEFLGNVPSTFFIFVVLITLMV